MRGVVEGGGRGGSAVKRRSAKFPRPQRRRGVQDEGARMGPFTSSRFPETVRFAVDDIRVSDPYDPIFIHFAPQVLADWEPRGALASTAFNSRFGPVRLPPDAAAPLQLSISSDQAAHAWARAQDWAGSARSPRVSMRCTWHYAISDHRRRWGLPPHRQSDPPASGWHSCENCGSRASFACLRADRRRRYRCR